MENCPLLDEYNMMRILVRTYRSKGWKEEWSL